MLLIFILARVLKLIATELHWCELKFSGKNVLCIFCWCKGCWGLAEKSQDNGKDPWMSSCKHGFFEQFKMSESFSRWASLIHLCYLTPSQLSCPFLSMMSCSSISQSKSQVVFVTLKELFILYPGIPGFMHKHATVPARWLWL